MVQWNHFHCYNKRSRKKEICLLCFAAKAIYTESNTNTANTTNGLLYSPWCIFSVVLFMFERPSFVLVLSKIQSKIVLQVNFAVDVLSNSFSVVQNCKHFYAWKKFYLSFFGNLRQNTRITEVRKQAHSECNLRHFTSQRNCGKKKSNWV